MISKENLKSDPIRLLRAYRLAALLNFTIEPRTQKAITDEAFRINESAGERIRDELFQLFENQFSFPYISLMHTSGLLSAIFPELVHINGSLQNRHHQHDVFEHTMQSYSYLEKIIRVPERLFSNIDICKNLTISKKNASILKYIILLHDIGKPLSKTIDQNGGIHFYRHEHLGADIAKRINSRLKLSNQDRRHVDFIIRNHLKPLYLFSSYFGKKIPEKAISRFLLNSGERTLDLVLHSISDIYGKGHPNRTKHFIKFAQSILSFYFTTFKTFQRRPSILNGNDLINEFGLTPSPFFSKILKHVYEQQISNNIHTKEDAFSIVKNFLKHHTSP